MTTETILTNYQIHSTLHDNFLPFSTQTEGFARAIEQAVLQSPEIQALRKDAERYRWLRDGGNDDIGVVRGFGSVDYGSTSVACTYEEGLDGEQLDEAIDESMEQQK